MESNKYYFGTIIYIIALFVGSAVIKSSWSGTSYYVRFGDTRTIAAIHPSFDYSDFKGRTFQLKSQERMIEAASIKVLKDDIEIKLGIFQVQDPTSLVPQQPVDACDVYKKVQLTFQAYGVFINGKPSLLSISAPCVSNIEDNMLATIRFPISNFKDSSPKDFSKGIVSYINSDISASIENPTEEWPQKWELISITLKNMSGTVADLNVSREYIENLDEKTKSEQLTLSDYIP